MNQLSKGTAATYNALGAAIDAIATAARAVADHRHEPRDVLTLAERILDICREIERVRSVDLRPLLERRGAATTEPPADLALLLARVERIERALDLDAQRPKE